jgi:hypothetical protein
MRRRQRPLESRSRSPPIRIRRNLDNMRFGVDQARGGWLYRCPLSEFEKAAQALIGLAVELRGFGFRCLGTTLPVTGFGRNVLQPLNPPVIGHVMDRGEFIEWVVTKPCGNSVWLSGTSAPHRERSGRMAPVGAIVANARARDRVAGAAS